MSAAEQFYAELHRELLDEYASEKEEPWVAERLGRVMERLNAVRQDGTPLLAHCLRIPVYTAFTVPGRNPYIARQLLERLPSDESTAFVLGHEVAHHDLQHLQRFHTWLDVLPKGEVGLVLASLVWKASHRLYGPERESQANQYAIELCLDAGFDGELCPRPALARTQANDLGFLSPSAHRASRSLRIQSRHALTIVAEMQNVIMESPLRADEFLAALDAFGREWRELAQPTVVRALAARGVSVRVRGQ